MFAFNGYILRISIVALLYLFLPSAISSIIDCGSTTSSFVCTTTCFFILTLIASKLLLRDSHFVKFFLAVYIAEILIGVIHYLVFIDPNYFSGTGVPKLGFHEEMEQTFQCVANLADFKQANGIFNSDDPEWWVAHKDIWSIITIPLCWLSVRWMNLGPITTFFLLLGSMNMVVIAKKYGFSYRKIRTIQYLTAFYPVFLLNDAFSRDATGLGLISIGVTLFIFSRNSFQKIISLFVLLYFCYVQRTMYPVAFIAALGVSYISNKKNVAVKFVLFPLLLLVVAFIYGQLDNLEGTSYSSGYINYSSYIMLPIKILFGFIGPFPWRQFLNEPHSSYQLGDYAQGVIQLGILLCVFANIKKLINNKHDILFWFGSFLLLSGVLTTFMHITYISFGVFFVLPWIVANYSDVLFVYVRKSFCILLFLNIVVLLTGNIGFSSLWR